MPLFILKIKADLENVQRLYPQEDNLWQFNVSSPDGEVREGITFSTIESLELDGSKGTANFIMKWKGSSVQSYIKIVDLKKCDGSYYAEDTGKFKSILGLECRGLEPILWTPSNDFFLETTHGKVFPTDLTEKDWADYDEEYDDAFSVMNLEYVIERG